MSLVETSLAMLGEAFGPSSVTGSVILYDVPRWPISMQIIVAAGGATGCTVSLEASLNGTNWFSLVSVPLDGIISQDDPTVFAQVPATYGPVTMARAVLVLDSDSSANVTVLIAAPE